MGASPVEGEVVNPAQEDIGRNGASAEHVEEVARVGFYDWTVAYGIEGHIHHGALMADAG
jgi:hypothetical protein